MISSHKSSASRRKAYWKGSLEGESVSVGLKREDGASVGDNGRLDYHDYVICGTLRNSE